MRIFAFVAILFLLFGCGKIYTKIYDEKEVKIPLSCLKIKSDNLIIEYVVKNNPFIKNIEKKECQNTLKISSNYVTSCTSPTAKSIGTDFDGFVRFEILKDNHLIYRNQRDFKGHFTDSVAKSLIDRLKKDLKFSLLHN